MTATDRKGVVLDSTLTASQARHSTEVKHILTGVLKEAIIRVYREYFYRVDFGPDVCPRVHIVSYDLYCTCRLEADCPAVTAVKYYLEKGACESAKIPCLGYFPAAPHYCPVCGARACYEPRLSSRSRGMGWMCAAGGVACYWKHRGIVLQVAYAEKWKRLGVDPATFKEQPAFSFKDGYDPERIPVSFCSNCKAVVS